MITGMSSFYSARQALLMRSYAQLTSIRLTRKAVVERFFSDRLNECSFIADRGSENIVVPLNTYYSGWVIFDSTGTVIKKHNTDRVKLNVAQMADLFMVDFDRVSNSIKDFADTNAKLQPQLIAAARISKSGHYLGLAIKPGVIDSMMLEVSPSHGLGHSGETYLVGSDNLMRTSSRFIENSIMKTVVNSVPFSNAIAGKEGTMTTSDYRGVKVLSSYSPVNVTGLSWIILAEIDYSEATASANSIRNSIILMSLLTAIALFILTYVISKSITRPLKRLTQATDSLGKGDISQPLPVESSDELGELTEAFNLMAKELLNKEEALKSERIMKVTSAIDGQDKERQRLSRELHDGIGQTIIGVRLRLAAMEHEIPDKIVSTYKSVISLTDNLIDDIRAASNALMPPALAEFGLMSAIRSIANNISDTYGVVTIVNGELPDGLFGRKPVLYMFRIVQEALNNAARHAEATTIVVNISLIECSLEIEITDDGVGFDTSKVAGGHGLVNIKERVSLLKGSVLVDSSPERGTTVLVKIPVNKVQYDKIVAG